MRSVYWQSWFDLHTFSVEHLESRSGSEDSARRILNDLRRYLEFQGYLGFRHWSSLELPNIENLPQYRHTYGFTALRGLARVLWTHVSLTHGSNC